MANASRAVTLGVICTVTLLLTGSSASAARRQVVHTRGILLLPPFADWPPARIGNACVLIAGLVWSGRFFEGLERARTEDGPRFRKHGRLVDYFPSRIDFELDASGMVPLPDGKCYDTWPPRHITRPGLPPIPLPCGRERLARVGCGLPQGGRASPHPYHDILPALRLEVSYVVNGRKLGPLSSTLIGREPPGRYPPFRVSDDTWKYHFVVLTKGVRLADPIVFSIFKRRDGEKVAELTLRL